MAKPRTIPELDVAIIRMHHLLWKTIDAGNKPMVAFFQRMHDRWVNRRFELSNALAVAEAEAKEQAKAKAA